ncbi:MAG: hypothetical protein KGM44_04435 [bacterium]|nr:hypothetical protein [bacterium]
MSETSFSLTSDRGIALRLHESRFFEAERVLGLSMPYPFAGWASWCARREQGTAVLSACFSGGTLRAVEWYLARAPAPLPPLDLGEITLGPAGVRLGDGAEALPPSFTAFAEQGPVYDRTLCANADGGVAFCMLLDGRIVRIALYAS